MYSSVRESERKRERVESVFHHQGPVYFPGDVRDASHLQLLINIKVQRRLLYFFFCMVNSLLIMQNLIPIPASPVAGGHFPRAACQKGGTSPLKRRWEREQL